MRREKDLAPGQRPCTKVSYEDCVGKADETESWRSMLANLLDTDDTQL